MYELLRGMRVVECASFIAAPSACLHLQQMGAEIIRIDPIGGGPDYHRWPIAENRSSFYWEGLNKGKRSISVDLSKPEGRDLAIQIITAPGENSGLFVTNFPVEGFLSHERLRGLRKDLITARVMGWADGTPAVDYTINAAVGVPYMTGSSANGLAPVNHVLPAWDLLAGAYTSFTLLAAERHRRMSGEGQEIRVPLSDVAIASLGNLGQIAEVMNGVDRERNGNSLFGAFGRDFVTSDGVRIMVVAITSRQWTGLVDALQIKDEVAAIETFLSLSFTKDEGLRYVHQDLLLPVVEKAIANRNASDLASAFDKRGVCWAHYQTLKTALAKDARLAPVGPLFENVLHPSGHTYPAPGSAVTLSDAKRAPVVRAPFLGEHTDQLLGEILGLSNTEIGLLHDARLVA